MNQPVPEIKHQYRTLAFICVGFIALSCILQITQGPEWASLNITKAKDGEYWRLITGHLVHLNWHHYLMNMTGLTLCLAVFRDDLAPRHWIPSFLFISLFSSIGLLTIHLDYYSYVGFSDVLHGWILLGVAALVHKEPKMALTVFVLFWMKIIEENMDLAFFTSYGVTGHIAKESHIFGAIGGLTYGALFLPSFQRWLKKPYLQVPKGEQPAA